MNAYNAKNKLNKILQKIIKCKKKGIYPKSKIVIDGYTLVKFYSDLGYIEREQTYKLHFDFIKGSIEESITALKSVPKE